MSQGVLPAPPRRPARPEPFVVTWRSGPNRGNLHIEGFSDPGEVSRRLNELWDEGHTEAMSFRNDTVGPADPRR